MASVAFRALDAHVIAGRGDHPALVDERGALTYAGLLAESSALAGAFQHLGISSIAVGEVSLRVRLTVLMACARSHGQISDDAPFRLESEPPVLSTPVDEVTWDVLRRAGQSDPLAAPAHDPEGYVEALMEAWDAEISGLISGQTLT